ncbi:MAG: acyltransferase family protein [Bauldia sp.]
MRRLAFVGWLRVFLIAVVVAHHAAQAYGPTADQWPVEDPAKAEWFGAFFALNATYFMGFFFLIAGYFTGSSYDRKGGAAYVRDRLVRLGVPLLFFAFIVFPLFIYYQPGQVTRFVSLYVTDYIGHWNIVVGHLWFVEQILVYGLLYALWRTFRPQAESALPPPNYWTVLFYVLALGIVGVLVRIAYPQDVWVHVLWLVPVEPAHLPQHLSLFVIGIVAGRGDWFNKIPARMAWWFPVGVAAFALALAVNALQGRSPALLAFQPLWGFFEAFVCVGVILGSTVLFRTYCNRPGPWLDRLDGNVYGVYLIHWFVVLAIQAAILNLAASATAKFAIVTVLALAVSFALSVSLRILPAVRRVV